MYVQFPGGKEGGIKCDFFVNISDFNAIIDYVYFKSQKQRLKATKNKHINSNKLWYI